jgi:hypothetical protein
MERGFVMTDTTLNRAGRALLAFLVNATPWVGFTGIMLILNMTIEDTDADAARETLDTLTVVFGLFGAWYVLFKPAVDAWRGTK